jgi:uncharacterized protein YggL (DUF469 family)
MTERHTLKLTKANHAKALQGVTAAVAKGKDGKPWTLELRERTRTDEQNDALHGLIDQIIRQRPEHNGIRMDKALYKAAFMQALGEEIRFLPTLDGKGVFPIGLSTSKLSVSRFAELMEFVLAWCAEEGITVEHFDDARDGEAPNTASPKAA